MVQRMQEMRRQHMEMMQANPQAMPPMGPGRGMMNPQMMQQRMQEMRQQHMEMMQANRRGMPMAGANAAAQAAEPDQEATVAAEDTAAMPTGPGMGCAHRKGEGGMRGYGMKKQMMAMRQQHMQSVEARLANIEGLMRELVDLAKSNR